MLTRKIIHDASPSERSRILWDTSVKGFGVRIYAGGRKSYIISVRNPHAPDPSRKQFMTLADVRSIRLREARLAAARQIVAIRDLLRHKTMATADHYVRHVGAPERKARFAVSSSIARIVQNALEPAAEN